MKFLLSMIMVLSLSISSQIIAEDSPVYEANKAEYYVNVFKDGKDIDDLMKWSKEWAEWASEGEPGEVFKNYSSALLVPYYGHNLYDFDVIWVGTSPNPEEHYVGNEYWMNNGEKLIKKLPVTFPQVIDTWQRTVSETPDGSAGYVVYSDCKLGEGVTNEQFYDAYYAYAQAAKKLGDVAGRKMIWPQTGVEPGWDFDFVQAVFTTSIGAYGKNWTNFWEKSEEMPELEALAALGGSCTNERSFTIIPVKS
jgi:hypothetical protein